MSTSRGFCAGGERRTGRPQEQREDENNRKREEAFDQAWSAEERVNFGVGAEERKEFERGDSEFFAGVVEGEFKMHCICRRARVRLRNSPPAAGECL